ncbi:MAG: deoxyribonuclease IV [Thermodesulfobacteriota bacterium]
MALLGAHESVSGGLHLAFERIEAVGGEALQIFTRNQRQWNPKPLSSEEIAQFAGGWEKCPAMPIVSHGSYLVNLGSPKEEVRHKSVEALKEELRRCAALNIPQIVMHPGSHGGDGVEVGLERVVKGLDQCFQDVENDVKVLLETTAGQGNGLGSRFDELGWIIDRSQFPDRLAVCLDTCHVFAAGYDISDRKGYEATMIEFEEKVGIDRLAFFHLNDSKKELASRVDRHEHIGKGCIGLEGFRLLLNDSRFEKHGMTLETPKGKDLQEDRDNLQVLRSLIGNKG